MYNPDSMPDRDCLYDPRVDMRPVDPNGFVDLNNMVANGVIDGDIVVDETKFNGVADPDALLPRPHDNFERMRQYRAVKESLRAASASAEAGHSTEQAK